MQRVSMVVLATLCLFAAPVFSQTQTKQPATPQDSSASSSQASPNQSGAKKVVAESTTTTARVPEARSLDGKPLFRFQPTGEQLAKLDADLALAKEELAAEPNDPYKQIWVGRRLAYLWRYNDAVGVYSKAIQANSELPHLYRHRGHRYITLRKFDLALNDLTRASKLIEGQIDEIEQDGMPNAAGVPLTTLHSNIWYHLGLVQFLQGDFASSDQSFKKCIAAAENDENRIAASDWRVMCLQRLGRKKEADAILDTIAEGLELRENHAYYQRLLLYKGKLKPQDLIADQSSPNYSLDVATYGFGVANWYLCQGKTKDAKALLESITEGEYWPAFGFIAAEVELERMRKADSK